MSTSKQKENSLLTTVKKWFGLRNSTQTAPSTSSSKMPSTESEKTVQQHMRIGVKRPALNGPTIQMEFQNIGLLGERMMRIKTVSETPEGEVEFQANLSNEELGFLLEFAVNNLIAQGVVPFTMNNNLSVQSLKQQ